MTGPLIIGFNPHAPGPIGDVTASTIAGTTLTLTSTTNPQLKLYYSGSFRNEISTTSNGTLIISQRDRSDFIIQDTAGNTALRFIGGALSNALEFGEFFFSYNGVAANRSKFTVYGNNTSGSGVGCPGANQASLMGGGFDVFVAAATKGSINFPFVLKSYTVATLPSASTMGAGAMAYASDAAGTPCVAMSNGTAWKRCDDTSVTVS